MLTAASLNRNRFRSVAAALTLAASVPAAAAAPEARAAIDSPVTLESALEYAWTHHPAMKAAQAMIEAKHGARTQAGLWPRMELELSHAEKTEARSEDSVSLSQRFELGGKRGARIDAASAAVFLAEAEAADTWLGLRARIKGAFARAAYARRALAAASAKASAAREYAALIRELHSAGRLPENELNDADQLAGTALAAEKAIAAGAETADRLALLSAGIERHDAVLIVQATDQPETVVPSAAELAALVLTNSSPVRIARAARMSAQARERLAQTAKWPDLVIGGRLSGVTMEDGSSATGSGIMASFDIPLFNRNQGERLEAKKELAAKDADMLKILQETGERVLRLVAELKQRIADYEYCGKTALPLAEKNLRISEDSWKRGRISRTEHLKTVMKLLDTRLKTEEARLMSEIAEAELETLTLSASQDFPIPGRSPCPQ